MDDRPRYKDLDNLERDITKIQESITEISKMLSDPDKGVYARIRTVEEAGKDNTEAIKGLARKLDWLLGLVVAICGVLGPELVPPMLALVRRAFAAV